MCLSSDILPESRQKCQINGHSTWIRVECRYPLASGAASRPDTVEVSCCKCVYQGRSPGNDVLWTNTVA